VIGAAIMSTKIATGEIEEPKPAPKSAAATIRIRADDLDEAVHAAEHDERRRAVHHFA
jgi:hypothetical protein